MSFCDCCIACFFFFCLEDAYQINPAIHSYVQDLQDVCETIRKERGTSWDTGNGNADSKDTGGGILPEPEFVVGVDGGGKK